MNELSYLQAVVLGILQGLTEFLPISSSGHLALVQHVMDLDPESQGMILFDVAVHLATVIAVAAVFAGQFVRYFRRLAAESTPRFTGRRTAWRIALLGVLASVPTALIGLLFKDQLEAAFGKPIWIAAALVFTGVLLWLTGKAPRARRGWRRFGGGRALLVGLGQGIAILPGVSRSGTTISVALLLGIRREWAAQFSFFIAIPAICGAAGLHFKDVLETGVALGDLLTGPLLVGAACAMATGYVALRLLLAAVRRARLHYFCYYCWALALVVFVALR